MLEAMPNAMPGALLEGCSEQSTQRTQRNATDERVQDSAKSPPVPDAAGPVDKPKSVVFPERVWGRLATLADDRHVSIADLIVVGVDEVLSPAMNVKRHVIRLVKAGFADREIGYRLDLTNAQVASIRRAANLPANHRYGRSGGRSERKTA